MKAYLLRMTVLLITFALGVGSAVTVRDTERGGVGRADSPNQKPFVLVVRKRVDSPAPRNACY